MADGTDLENLTAEALNGLVRVGTVTDRQMEKRLVRVWFGDDNICSGWLPVIINQDVSPDYEYDEIQWTEFDTENREPPTGVNAYAAHRHKIKRKPYLPKIGDQVLVVYLPVWGADGFVIGGIQKWR